MLRLFSKFKPFDWVLIALLTGVVIVQVYFDVHLPDYSAELMRRLTETNILTGMRYSTADIWRTGGRMALYAAGSLGASIVGGFMAAYLASKLGRQIRDDLFSKVQAFGFEETGRFSTASLITRSTNDIGQVQMVAMLLLRVAISAPVTAIWAITRINQSSWEITLTTAIAIGILILVLLVLCIFALPKFRLIQKLTDRLNAVTRQNLTGLRVVKAYNADKFEQAKFGEVNKELNSANLFANSIMGMMMPVLMLVINGVNLAIFWIGAHLINTGSLSFPDLIQFSGLVMQVLMAFIMISMLLVMTPRAQVSARRISEVLNTKEKIKDPEAPKQFDESKQGEIEFDNVSFKYPNAENNILENISFRVGKGQTAAFIGSTGSGKSTLINLVPRFYDISDGSLKVGGVDIREVRQEDLRAKIGYVPQKGVLFGGTIESNIGYSGWKLLTGEKDGSFELSDNNKSLETIKKAAHIAMAEEFIDGLKDGYQSKVSQGGKNFSGGQKQRMSIARAVAAEPEIFIFDDSFSALDYKTDREVRARLKKHLKGATCLIVAQRIGTIMDADLIVVLEEGKIVGKGTHKELLKSCEAYKEIALSQLTEEELK
ncbi:MAG: ABC transporter ATP-binding protein/permease [Firmicutes bacterium]|nr:ABC transporter ATP-binding protein/permease [Bacillota bacterium]